MAERKFERLDYVQIIAGPHRGEKGQVRELFTGNQYSVKVLTGPDKDRKGTFIAKADDLLSYALIIGQAITEAHDNYVKSVLRPIGSNPARFSDDDWKTWIGRAAIKAVEEMP